MRKLLINDRLESNSLPGVIVTIIAINEHRHTGTEYSLQTSSGCVIDACINHILLHYSLIPVSKVVGTVRKLNVILLHLRRTGYTDAANALWLILVLAKGNLHKLTIIKAWLIDGGSIEPLFKQTEFLYEGSEIITIKAGFRSLTKLLAVLPKEIK